MPKVDCVTLSKIRVAIVALSCAVAAASAQTAAPHQAGTVKSTSATGITLTTSSGQEVTVTVPASAKILVVAPGSRDLQSATAGTMGDVQPADKIIVTGSPGDTGSTLTAVRVILMKSAAIAQSHAAEDTAWSQGAGGIVRSIDAEMGKLVLANGAVSLTVLTTPSTIVRRYADGSVRFADAQVSTLAAIHTGDQLRVRGAKGADGTITADELVAGTFHNYSGLIASIDAAAGTLTLKDLATKRTVMVGVTPGSDVRQLPAMMAQRVAASMKGTGATAGGGAGGPGAAGATARPAGGASPEGADSDTRRAGRAGVNLSQMLSRLPTQILSDLKVGDAVMIVATSSASDPGRSTAVTLLSGVDPILTAPSGASTTLTPWNVGGGAPSEGGGESQ